LLRTFASVVQSPAAAAPAVEVGSDQKTASAVNQAAARTIVTWRRQ
jgi:hypothetical protein